MRITWSRTVIGGKTAPEDFYAHDELGRGVGRIYRQITGHEAGGWWWTMNAWGDHIDRTKFQDFSGVADEKQQAADLVRERFEACLKPIGAETVREIDLRDRSKA